MRLLVVVQFEVVVQFGVMVQFEIRRRRWLMSAQGWSLRQPWDRHTKGVLTLKGLGDWRTLTGLERLP